MPELKNILLRTYERAIDADISSSAAQVAFFFSFSLFPLALFIVSLFGIILGTAETFKEQLFFHFQQRMPPSAFELFRVTIEEVSSKSSTSKLTLSLVVVLWSASSGFDSLRIALNKVHNLKETRSWLKTRSLSILITIAISLLVALSLTTVFYGRQLVTFIFVSMNLSISSPFLMFFVYWVISLAVILITFEIYYTFLPDTKQIRLYWITPGTIVGIVLWLLLSYGFRTYLFYYGSYDQIYGSIAALIILMFWLYLNALAILVGGVVNAIIGELSGIKQKEVS